MFRWSEDQNEDDDEKDEPTDADVHLQTSFRVVSTIAASTLL